MRVALYCLAGLCVCGAAYGLLTIIAIRRRHEREFRLEAQMRKYNLSNLKGTRK